MNSISLNYMKISTLIRFLTTSSVAMPASPPKPPTPCEAVFMRLFSHRIVFGIDNLPYLSPRASASPALAL